MSVLPHNILNLKGLLTSVEDKKKIFWRICWLLFSIQLEWMATEALRLLKGPYHHKRSKYILNSSAVLKIFYLIWFSWSEMTSLLKIAFKSFNMLLYIPCYICGVQFFSIFLSISYFIFLGLQSIGSKKEVHKLC